MTTLHRVRASALVPQPWRNGGGETRELLCWPDAHHWSLRVSLADIAQDGPFSAFPGVTRWFAVVEGAGVALGLGSGERLVRVGDPPLRFDGAEAPACRLLDGRTRDLNLMARGGESSMQPVRAGVPWHAGTRVRALFTAVAGHCSAAGQHGDAPAHTLLWSDKGRADPWIFTTDARAKVAGWWLAFSPRGDSR